MPQPDSMQGFVKLGGPAELSPDPNMGGFTRIGSVADPSATITSLPHHGAMPAEKPRSFSPWASFGLDYVDDLLAGAQGVKPDAASKAQLAPSEAQWIYAETGGVQNAETQFVARGPDGHLRVYLRSPELEGSRAAALGRALAVAQPENFPAVVPTDLTAGQKLLRDFEATGVPPSLPAVSQGRGAALASKLASNVPLAGASIRAAAGRALEGTAEAAERAAAGYGRATGALEAGEALQRGVNRFAKVAFPAKADRLYDDLKSYMMSAPPVDLPNTLQALGGPMERFPTKPALGEAITNPKLRRFHEILTGTGEKTQPVAAAPARMAAPSRPRDIVQFLLDEGGIRDQGGELAALDLHLPNKGYFGRLARANGMPLDEAREAAVEAGYLHPDSDINDLLTALYNTTHGAPVFNPSDPAVYDWMEHQRAQQAADEGEIPLPGEVAPPPAVRQVVQKLSHGAALTYPEVSEFRSYIGRLLGDPVLVSDIPRADLKQVYGALSRDMKVAAAKQGPQALQAFRRANAFYNAGLDRIDRIDGLLNGSPEQAFGKINRAAGPGTSADASLLSALKKSVSPGEWGDVGAAVIRKLGEPGAGAKDVLAERQFSPSSFAMNWSKLSDRAKDALFGADVPGSRRAALESLARVAQSQKNVSRIASWGPAGAAVGGGMEGGAVVYALSHLGAILAHPVLGATIASSGYLMSKVLSSEGFARWMYAMPAVAARAPNSMVAGQRAFGLLLLYLQPEVASGFRVPMPSLQSDYRTSLDIAAGVPVLGITP